jgi:CxxC motif-containing protein
MSATGNNNKPATVESVLHTTPPTLEKKIQKWVELDDEIKVANEEIKDIRTERSIINEEIVEIIQERNLLKATVNISDGKLRFVSTKQTAPLTLTYIEKCLKEIITNETQVETIMSYIKNKRETKTTTEIKRVYNEKPSQKGEIPNATVENSDSDS